jgi:hypothetical protein
MKIVRSFSEFIGESTVNEAADKFKIETLTPKTAEGEVARFKLVLREFEPSKPIQELALLSAMSKPEFAKFALDKAMIGFISVTKQRDAGFAQPRDLIKGIVIFKKAEGFDTTKATPFVSVSGVSLYNVEDAVKMKATETTLAQDTKVEVAKPEPAVPATADIKPGETPKPEDQKKESGNKEYDLVKDLAADNDVLEFLKSKLLNADKPKFSKAANKVAEIKAVQTLISKFTLADKKTPSTAAAGIKKSGIDGIYGDGTAAAIAWTTPDSSKPVATITTDNVGHFAKWCKFMGITKAELEKIFAIKIEDGGKKDDTKTEDNKGPKYYFVNKGWTYSPETDPYKK